MTISSTQAEERQWLRAGNLLYTLTQVGWRKGEPTMANRITVRVDGDHRYAEPGEVEELTERLFSLLTTRSPALGEEEVLRASVAESAAAPQEVCPANSCADLLKEARTELFSLCEDSADTAYNRLQTPDLTEHEMGYLRGTKAEAKAISRAMADVFRDLLAKATGGR